MVWQVSFPRKQILSWRLVYRRLLGGTLRINSPEDMKETGWRETGQQQRQQQKPQLIPEPGWLCGHPSLKLGGRAFLSQSFHVGCPQEDSVILDDQIQGGHGFAQAPSSWNECSSPNSAGLGVGSEWLSTVYYT